MAASMLCRMNRRCWITAGSTVIRRGCSSRSPPPHFNKLLLRLSQHFYDVEYLLGWNTWMRNQLVWRKNALYGYTQRNYGVNVAAAYYILRLGGGFRFSGQSEWFRANSKGKFSYDFLNTPEATIEEIDLSRSLVNHAGLDNIVSQKGLRSLSLCGCPEVDDWFLARLQVFGGTLEELDVSHCPCLTEGGLAALQHLRKLRHLDVSSLPRLTKPGLVRILLEEMLPHCTVTGAEYDQGLLPTDGLETPEPAPDIQTNPSSMRHTHTR